MATSVTLKIDLETYQKMVDFYNDSKVENNGEYVAFSAKTIDDVVITIYESSKGHKALFVGENSLKEALIWDENASINEVKTKVKSEWKYVYDQIGSDEVGTGDFFGPVIVVASYVDHSIITLLKELGVDDSKKLTDEKILQIVPQILDKVVYSRLTCNPSKYNEMVEKGYSMNAIKAILHNEALQNVYHKVNKFNINIYIDEFCSPSNYYSYLQGKYEPLINNVTFETKGESYYPSVAVSSMIARYSFLKYFEELEEKLGVSIPKGASKKVDELALSLKESIGLNELTKLVKKNFKNYTYLIEDNK